MDSIDLSMLISLGKPIVDKIGLAPSIVLPIQSPPFEEYNTACPIKVNAAKNKSNTKINPPN